MKKIGNIPSGGFGRLEKWVTDEGVFIARKFFEPHIPRLSPDDQEKLKKRFAREVKVQSQLAGDHVVPILRHDLTGTAPYYDMPFCDGALDEFLNNPRDPEQVSAALADVLSGLEHLHSLGYTHRDLKPQNVLWHEGKWKLADFGLVMPPSGSVTIPLTSVGSAWGSPPYAAPEQAHDFGHVTNKADIYAFGCILHDFFGKPPRIPYQRQTAPGQVGVIIEKCTEVDPARRFKSAADVRAALLTSLASASFRTPSATAQEWVLAISSIPTWTPERCDEFANFLLHATNEDKSSLFNLITEEQICQLAEINVATWDVFAREYCRWTDRAHVFGFCDVLTIRLTRIFEIGGLEIKALAAISMAKLGASHNRWFVMRKLLAICSPSLNPDVAARLAIEIFVEDAKLEFLKCVDHLGLNKDSYHPSIASVLDSK